MQKVDRFALLLETINYNLSSNCSNGSLSRHLRGVTPDVSN